MDTAFESLISPLKKYEFFSDYWGKEYYISQGLANRYKSLFSWDALNEILSTHRFEYPRLRLFSAGKVIPPEEYIISTVDRRGIPYSTQDSHAVLRLLRAGSMLHITSVGDTWKPLASFAAQIEQTVVGRVQVNLHAGFAESKGFNTHWDGHDVYAIQIDGKKKWHLYGVTAIAPLAVPPDEKRGAPTRRLWEGVLDSGDMLYLPRGYWHSTQFLDDASLHLTFAVQHPTGIDYIQWLMKQPDQIPEVRRDIPAAVFDMPRTGESAREGYLAGVKDYLASSVSPGSFSTFLTEYRTTLGNVNHIHLSPTERSDHETHRI